MMDLTVEGFEGYALLASGSGRKLERLGDVVLDRPAPQAIWPRERAGAWSKASAVFSRGEKGTGTWEIRGPAALPDHWEARWNGLRFEIRLTGFGNVGLFPEHTAHWAWMADQIRSRNEARVLNLFAYTGGASIACAKAGAAVTHVDSAKSVNSWAMANADRAGIPPGGIRFLAEDARKFVTRETRRERRYEAIILDPPTFGRGAKGEVWKIERDLHPLVRQCGRLLADKPLFVLLTCHSPGVTPSALRTVLSLPGGRIVCGEMLLAGAGSPLPAGCYARWTPQ